MNIAILSLLFLSSPQVDPPPRGITPLAPETFSRDHAKHLLLRAGFGGTPEDVDRIHAMGLVEAVRHLVDYESIADPLPAHGITPTPRPSRLELVRMTEQERQQSQAKIRQADLRKFSDLRAWWFERMIKSPRPLEEKMTLFWHGHLTSGQRDVRNSYHMALQNQTLRDLATGSWDEMLRTISRDPAMLEYLDNRQNVRRSPNENYARELMELFALGVGNYTEQDVKEAARAFTGWSCRESEFMFQSANHDFGSKTFLGQTGPWSGDDIIRIILEQDEAPRFIIRKLLTFLAAEPEDRVVEPLADLFVRAGFQWKPVLRTLFTSEWFYSDQVMGRRIKSPVDLVVGLAQSMGLRDIDGTRLARACDSIGQSLFEPPNVKGWDGGAAWVTSSNLLTRYNIAREMILNASASGSDGKRASRGRSEAEFSVTAVMRKVGAETAEDVIRVFESRFLAVPLGDKNRQSLLDFLNGADGSKALDWGARREVATKLNEALHLLTTTAEFQVN